MDDLRSTQCAPVPSQSLPRLRARLAPSAIPRHRSRMPQLSSMLSCRTCPTEPSALTAGSSSVLAVRLADIDPLGGVAGRIEPWNAGSRHGETEHTSKYHSRQT